MELDHLRVYFVVWGLCKSSFHQNFQSWFCVSGTESPVRFLFGLYRPCKVIGSSCLVEIAWMVLNFVVHVFAIGLKSGIRLFS